MKLHVKLIENLISKYHITEDKDHQANYQKLPHSQG
jgi:hypothetical protein